MFIDSHAHIDGPEYDEDRDEVIQRARAAGLSAILNVGTGDPHSGSLERAIDLAEKHQDIFAAVGVHPHDARLFDDSAEQRIDRLVRGSARVIAWGEIGLDYHYDHSPREIQRQVFKRQLELALDADLPVIIHTREADADTIEILRESYGASKRGGIMHCFGGTLELAQAAMELGFLISFSGNITFKKAEDIRSVASQLPLDKLLIETDCPYLTPVPFRGKRNEPARVVEVARALAALHGIEFEEVAKRTSANFLKVLWKGRVRRKHPQIAPITPIFQQQIKHFFFAATQLSRLSQQSGKSAESVDAPSRFWEEFHMPRALMLFSKHPQNSE